MGARGPSKTPSALRLVRDGKYAVVNKDEPKAKRGTPTVPAVIKADKIAAAEWRRLTAELEDMGILHTIDSSSIAMLCSAWGDFVRACRALQESGPTCESENGNIKTHPNLRYKEMAVNAYIRLADRFGLSPSARTSIRTTEASGSNKRGRAHDPLVNYAQAKNA